MASDLSSGCTETIDILDEKEEGEISLEDVSSSEEGGMGHLTCGYTRTRPCSGCMSTWEECASWCIGSSKMYSSKTQNRRDPIKGKENRHHVKETGCATTKHIVSTLQEKNDDLVPISSDSDMEIVGLADISKQKMIRSSKTKKRKKKKNYETLTVDNLISSSSVDISIAECFNASKKDIRRTVATKKTGLNRTHYRELSPTHRSNRSRVISRSSLKRYRSPIRARSPYRPSRSSLSLSKSPILRKSRCRSRSPKRTSPRKSPSRIASKRLSKSETSPSSHIYIDRHGDVTKLLKRVKHLDSVGTQALESNVNRNKDHQSSLKEKLSNMMKKVPGSNGNATHPVEKSNIHTDTANDADDDDLALLRQKALETKQKKSNKQPDQQIETESEKQVITKNDDQDEEDLELRMIALRSAVMKKHQNRVQRGMKPGTNKKIAISRSESPFNQTFLDNIPIPGEELLKLASPPCTPPLLIESNHIEDMDLDTDVEREKEKLPYSPTDKITTDIPIDTELLGIEPSDVSFITLNEINNSPTIDTISTKDDQRSFEASIITNCTYFPGVYYASRNEYEIERSYLFSHSDTFQTDLNNGQTQLSTYLADSHSDNVMCDLIDGICCQEGAYSSTNTPMYKEPTVSLTLPVTKEFPVPSIPPNDIPVYSLQVHNVAILNSMSKEQLGNVQEDKYAYGMQALSKCLVADSPIMSALGSVSSNESMITIDDLPEMDGESGSLAVTDKNLQDASCISDKETSCIAGETVQEPLYMQGVPDVTKDVNKIPTLINRTLVPAPILKSNKQLQQPLLLKKHETHPEPTFKNAEMQPVVVIADINAKSNTVFKPMKLVPFTKKAQPVLTSSVAFNDSLNEDIENDASKNVESLLSNNIDSQKITDSKNPITDFILTNDSIPVRKKRKRARRNRRKTNALETFEKEINDLCINNNIQKDASTISPQQKIEESDRAKNNDDNKAQENCIQNKGLSNMENAADIQESINSTDVYMKNSQHTCTPNEGTEPKHTMLSVSVECPQKKDIEFHCLSTDHNSVMSKKAITKDNNNRRLSGQNVDEDEDELRAILLASLGKRTTKSLDTDVVSTPPVATGCTTTTDLVQITTQKTMNVTPTTASITRTMVNDIPLLPSTLSSSEVKVSDTIMKEVNRTPILSLTNNKRPATTAIISSSSKMMKKVLPMSTKIVNNTKKFRNTLVQGKLNSQKFNGIRNKTKLTETVWSANTKMHTSDTHRIVINLGSDTDSESESEKRQTNAPLSSSAAITERYQTQDSNIDFEKSLHKFLRDVRKEHESTAASKPVLSPQITKKDTVQTPIQTDPNKSSANLFTPSAVRHLPASQQEEYHRLKQQILEREKLKLQRKVSNNNGNDTNSSKILNAKVAESSLKSLPLCDKESTNIKHNQTKPKETDIDPQQSSTEIIAKNTEVTKNVPIHTSNTYTIADKNHLANAVKQTNSVNSQAKKGMKMMPNFSIQITNEIASVHTGIGSKTVENPIESVVEEKSVNEQQQLKPALRALSKDEINQKYAKIQLKQDVVGGVIVNNNKPSLQHDTANVSQCQKTFENDSITDNSEEEGHKNCKSNCSNSILFDASTLLADSNMDKEELTDTMETTILRSQDNAEHQQEINQDTSTSLLSENNSHKNNTDRSDVRNVIDKVITDDVWDISKKDVKGELDSIISLPELEQHRYLQNTEHKLVAKRYTVLDHLAEMSGNLRQWDMEKDLQNSLFAEVKKLKEQLRIAEERLQLQCKLVSSMGPKVSTARQKINSGRRECFKLSRICSVLGKRLIGKDYRIPEAGSQLLSDKLKDVANHTRQLSKKKRSSHDVSENFIFSNLSQQTSLLSELSKVTHNGESLSSHEHLANDIFVIDVAKSSNKTSQLEELSVEDTENLSILDSSQSLSIQPTPQKGCETLTNTLESCDNEQDTSNQDMLPSEPKLTSTPLSIRQNSEHAQRMQDISEPTTSSETRLSTVDSLQCHDSEQHTKSTTTTIEPYISILTHFKIPRNTDPNGVLCPYELMGTCNDGDCQFVHQSKSHA